MIGARVDPVVGFWSLLASEFRLSPIHVANVVEGFT